MATDDNYDCILLSIYSITLDLMYYNRE